MRDLAKISSEARSHVLGRVVGSYTNILTVKLFARLADESGTDDTPTVTRASLYSTSTLILAFLMSFVHICRSDLIIVPARWNALV